MSVLDRKGLFVKTFGCQMNEYDSEKVVQLLARSHEPVPSFETADLVMVNTCSVREKGEHKLYSLLGQLRELKRARPELIVGVMGCVAQQEGEAIAKRSSAVDFVVGTQNLSLIPGLLEAVTSGKGRQIAVDYRDEWEELPLGFAGMELAQQPDWIGNRVRALVSIQRGCNKNCSYCVVPTTRGKELSRSPEEILKEVRLKARLGAREVLLLGQTVNSYGRDRSPRYPFEQLIQDIAAVPEIERIRFTSPHPAEVRAPFIELYGSVGKLVPHIHLPVQSGSDRILRLMNRNYKRGRYLDIVASLRERLPAIALTTDVIVGFPSENEEDFRGTLELVELVGFHSAYCFRYSRRPNTEAISKFSAEEEVPEEVKQERLARLLELQQRISADHNRKLLGSKVEILIEGVRLAEREHGTSQAWGRTPENVPVEILANLPKADLPGPGNDRRSEKPLLREGQVISALVKHASAHNLTAALEAAPGSELLAGGVAEIAGMERNEYV